MYPQLNFVESHYEIERLQAVKHLRKPAIFWVSPRQFLFLSSLLFFPRTNISLCFGKEWVSALCSSWRNRGHCTIFSLSSYLQRFIARHCAWERGKRMNNNGNVNRERDGPAPNCPITGNWWQGFKWRNLSRTSFPSRWADIFPSLPPPFPSLLTVDVFIMGTLSSQSFIILIRLLLAPRGSKWR